MSRLVARLSRGLWTPRVLWHAPVDAFQQIAKLRRRDRDGARRRRGPDEAATLQPLGEQAQALAVVPQNLDQPTTPSAKHEKLSAVRIALELLLHQEQLKRDPHSGQLFEFRGRRGGLIKILWHDGQGLCLFAKRLERGRFIWPSASAGAVTITAAQLGYLLEGIDWRMPQHTWRPQAAG